ncbi:MAG TPA: hypothetical protein VMS17_25295 [Gemmataceae bacterium]|nr:hypothetical protein [Gemmataceae bacterium]
MIRDWIFEDNLLPFLTILAAVVRYDFIRDEWSAVRFGVVETDEENGRWYDYEFAGNQRAAFRLARSVGSSVIHLELESDSDTELRMEVAVQIAQRYLLCDRP